MASQVSIQKSEANRRNARKSTGPKTLRGKAISRGNALKHGLLAQHLVIASGDGREEREQFEDLHQSLRDDFQPVTPIEDLLVEKVATCFWRLARVIRCETGAIRRAADSAALDRTETRQDAFSQQCMLLGLSSQASSQLSRTSAGIGHLRKLLEIVEREVRENRFVSLQTQEAVQRSFGASHDFVWHCDWHSRWATDPAANPEMTEERKEIHRMILVDHVKLQGKELADRQKIAVAREQHGDESHLMSLSIPSEPDLSRLLRYEQTIERQLYRALAELERRQRHRKGEMVSPAVRIDVENN